MPSQRRTTGLIIGGLAGGVLGSAIAPGGSGLLDQMLARWAELVAATKDLLAGCPQQCDRACYSCLKTFRNQFHHESLDRHAAAGLVEKLAHLPTKERDIEAVYEEERPEEGTPSNTPEARLLRLLHDHQFPDGKCRHRITTSLGASPFSCARRALRNKASDASKVK